MCRLCSQDGRTDRHGNATRASNQRNRELQEIKDKIADRKSRMLDTEDLQREYDTLSATPLTYEKIPHPSARATTIPSVRVSYPMLTELQSLSKRNGTTVSEEVRSAIEVALASRLEYGVSHPERGTTLRVELTQSVLDDLHARARKRGLTISDAVRAAIESYLIL